jgi:hypothetical protein
MAIELDNHRSREARVITDQQLFRTPRSQAARRLAELGDRRRQLQHQQRDALLAREQAKREHDQLAERIEHAKAIALAHGDTESANLKRNRAKLNKLATDIDKQRPHNVALDRAVAALADEMTALARDS